MAFGYDNRSSVESGGSALILRFNGADGISAVDPRIISGSGTLAVTVAGVSRSATLSRVVLSGVGPFFAEYTLASAVTTGQAVTATGTANLFIDSADPTADGTEAFTDTNVHNDVSPATENTITTLCSLTTVKAYLGITTTDYDTLLTRMTKAATRAIERYCNRGLIQEARLETYDGEGAESIQLRAFPVRRVVSVYLTDGFEVFDRLDPSDYAIDYRTGVVRYRGVARGPVGTYPGSRLGGFHGPSPAFGDQALDVTVDYTGGYSTVPEDLEQVAVEVTAYMFQSRSQDPRMVSESIGDYSYTRATALLTSGAAGAFADALRPYRRELL